MAAGTRRAGRLAFAGESREDCTGLRRGAGPLRLGGEHRMGAPENRFKRRLLAGEPLDGLWLSLASPIAAEALSQLDFDWLVFDAEHACVDLAGLQPLMQAAATGAAAHVVRPPWNDPVLIKRVLDMGAQTILLPQVQNAGEAAAAVAASRYPPDGHRGVAGITRAGHYGAMADYIATANAQICVLVQVETGAALDRIEEIAAVPGVDGVFIGPADLAASLGYPGAPDRPEVQRALRGAAERLGRAGRPAGILATTTQDALRYRAWGYGFVAAGMDTVLLMRAARELLDAMRGGRRG